MVPVASPSSKPFVNNWLSQGLACSAMSALAAQGNRYRAGFAPIFRRRFRSKRTVSQVIAPLESVGERRRPIQLFSRTPNRRLVSLCQFAPVRNLRAGLRIGLFRPSG